MYLVGSKWLLYSQKDLLEIETRLGHDTWPNFSILICVLTQISTLK